MACSGGENLALFEDNTHAMVPRKRQHTQKRSFSYMKCRYTKPQKRKNLNNLLKDDDGSALAGRPASPDGETDAHRKDANRNSEERSGECIYLREKFFRLDLLLGTDNSIPNGHIGDLCKNTDDILIGNQAANEARQQFDKAKHLPSGPSSKGQNISAPVEVKNTCAPVVEPASPQSKQVLKPKKKRKKGFLSSKKKRKQASKMPAAKEKTESMASVTKNKTGSTPSTAAVEKTEITPSGAMWPRTMTVFSAGKKRKTGNVPADAKKRESGTESAASKKQETGKPSSAAKKQETGNSSSAAKKQKTDDPSSARKKHETENTPSRTKETESALNLKIEKAVPVAVNSRRSQRVPKPKVFAE